MRRRRSVLAAALVACGLIGALSPSLARAAKSGYPVLASHPLTGTPHFPVKTKTTEQVRQLVQCGGTMYAVGGFSTVLQGGRTYTRSNAFSFRASPPFTMAGWNPDVNGEVNSIAFVAGDCRDAYLGGSFTKVGRAAAQNIAEVSTAGTGGLIKQFGHDAGGPVETLAAYRQHILAGGFFIEINGSAADPYLASLNDRTGKDDGLLRLHISGHYSYPGVAPNATRVYNQQISHSGTLDL